MLETEGIDIVMNEDKLNLSFSNKKDFLPDDCEDIIIFLKANADGKMFNQIEIDFSHTFFEITDLMNELIKNSYLYRNKQTHVILNLGKIDLSNRMEYLHCLNKLGIKNYKINYFKNS